MAPMNMCKHDVTQDCPACAEETIAALNARVAELEANERAYEEIIGPMTYQEVADRIQELEGALRQSIVAIDDWLHIYAGEFCDSACVEESARRIGEYGTIGYIAEVQAKNRSALEAKHD